MLELSRVPAALWFALASLAPVNSHAQWDLLAVPQSQTSYLTGKLLEDETRSFQYWYHTGCPCGQGRRAHIISGTVRSQVVQADDGTIDFYWQATANASGPIDKYGTHSGGASEVALFDFFDPAFSYQAGWLTDSSGTAAPEGLTFASPRYSGFTDNDLGFYFGDFTLETTRVFFIDTDAPAYRRTAIASVQPDIWWRESDQVATFAPAPIPEPGTWLLMALGLGALGYRTTAGRVTS